ncbi:MAG: rcc01693 family protein [Pseudolabrys sp.]
MTPFPWKQATGFGLGVLRLSPEQFWRMTPRELTCAIEAATGRSAPLDRRAFTDLMKRYPDDRQL